MITERQAYEALGMSSETTFLDAYDIYLERRASLLAAGQDSSDDDVRRLDDAIEAIRTADRARRSRRMESSGDTSAAEDDADRVARAAEKAAARRRTEEMKLANAAEGWPTKWSPGLVDRFRRLGVSPAVGNGLAAAGWRQDEVTDAVRGRPPRGASLDAPTGAAEHHRRWRDTLRELWQDEWPPAPDGTILSMKRWLPDGSRSRHFVIATDDGYELREYVQSDQGWVPRAGSTADDLVAALRNNQALHVVPTDEIRSYLCRPEDEDVLREALRVVDRGEAPGAPDDELGSWQLAETVDVVGGRLLSPPCEVNDYRLVGFTSGSTGDSEAVALFDMDEMRFRVDRVVATSTWYSESGGAPISWDGGNSLAFLPEDLFQELQWGDNGHYVRIHVRPPVTEADLPDRLAAWIGDIEASISAALTLEPLSLPSDADAEEIALWEERLTELSLTFDLDVAPELVDEVRARLRETDATYRRTTDALAVPRGTDGRRLAAALDAVLEGEPIGVLRSAVGA